jgi:hypothetical protein
VVDYPRGKIATWVIYHVATVSVTIATWRNDNFFVVYARLKYP